MSSTKRSDRTVPRFVIWAGLAAVFAAGCGKSEPQRPPRFMFKSWVADLQIDVQGQRVKLEPSGYDATFTGYVDLPAGTKAADVQPSITVPSPCGTAGPKKIDRAKPNESNVVVITISESDMPRSFGVVFAPNLPAVTLGSHTIAANTERAKLYGECAFDVKVGGQTFAVAQRPSDAKTLFVTGQPQTCYRSGLATWSRSGSKCGGESRTDLRGAGAYWLDRSIYYAFQHVPQMIETFKKDCEYRAFVDRC